MTDPLKFSQLLKKPSLENALKALGESKNGAIIITCAIAGFKGVFRPIFTMMDKKSDPETKKYAAIREGLTEVVAIPIYAATPFIIEKTIINNMKSLKQKTPEQLNLIKGNMKFLSVCAATLLIPAICNVVQPPIMAAYKKRQDAKKAKTGLDITSNTTVPVPTVTNKPQAPTGNLLKNAIAPVANSGMKVGN